MSREKVQYDVYICIEDMVQLHFYAILEKGNNFWDFLFASLGDKTLPKGLL